MTQYEIRIGKDVSAYGTISVDLDHEPTKEEVLEIVRAQEGDEELEVDWETMSGLRVVHVEGVESEAYLFADLPVEPVYYDAGQLLQTALGRPGAVARAERLFPLLEAARFLCIDRKAFAQNLLDLVTDQGALAVLRKEAAGE